MGFASGSVVKNLPANAGNKVLIPGLGRSPEEEWQPTPVLLPGKSHGQRSLVGYSLCDLKESDNNNNNNNRTLHKYANIFIM